METIIEWIVDFYEYFEIPLILIALYIVYKLIERKYAPKNGQTTYHGGSEYHYGNHSPDNDPDFSYMNQGDDDDSGQNNFMDDPYGNRDNFDPYDAEQVAYVESYDDNK